MPQVDTAPAPPGIRRIDLFHLGQPHVIGSYLVGDASGWGLVDPGPSSTLPHLERQLADWGLKPGDLDAVLLTHIHLDHAGATGSLLRHNPNLRVLVHERGAPHMIAPERLMESVATVFGPENVDRLWGEMVAVPEGNIELVGEGDSVAVGKQTFEVGYTPGHASHHVAYFAADTRTCFAGDVAGVRMPDTDYVFPPTPPPDIHFERWKHSIEKVRAWDPVRVALTHFGWVTEVGPHLDRLVSRIDRWKALGESLLDEKVDSAESEQRFFDHIVTTMREQLSAGALVSLTQAGRPDLAWSGVVRHLRRMRSKLKKS